MENTKSRMLNLFLMLLALSLVSFSYVSDGKIKGWFLAGSDPGSYEIGLEANSEKGGNIAYLKSTVNPTNGFGTIMQSFEPLDYLGKKIKLTGNIKAIDIVKWSVSSEDSRLVPGACSRRPSRSFTDLPSGACRP